MPMSMNRNFPVKFIQSLYQNSIKPCLTCHLLRIYIIIFFVQDSSLDGILKLLINTMYHGFFMYLYISFLINKLETCFLTLLNPKIFRKSSSLHIHRKFFSKHLSPTVKNCFQNWKAHLLKFCRSAGKVGYWCSALITSERQRFACLYCKKNIIIPKMFHHEKQSRQTFWVKFHT